MSDLLRQPHRFEGLLHSGKRCEIDSLLIADSKGVPEPCRGLDSAANASNMKRHVSNHRVAAVEPPQHLDPRRLDGSRTYAPPTTNALVATIEGGVRSEIALVQLYVWTKRGKESLEVAAGEELVGSAGELYVLLRHRPRSIAQVQARASAAGAP